MRYFLGLGGNLGDRESSLRRCRDLLQSRSIRILRRSSVYETEPVGSRNQPWFLNQVVEVETEMEPEKLLDAVQSIEREMGREPGPIGGPRVIDIDILTAGERIWRTDRLQIPHPRLAQRYFVLVPFDEIAPEVVHPGMGKTIRELRAECPDESAYSLFG